MAEQEFYSLVEQAVDKYGVYMDTPEINYCASVFEDLYSEIREEGMLMENPILLREKARACGDKELGLDTYLLAGNYALMFYAEKYDDNYLDLAKLCFDDAKLQGNHLGLDEDFDVAKKISFDIDTYGIIFLEVKEMLMSEGNFGAYEENPNFDRSKFYKEDEQWKIVQEPEITPKDSENNILDMINEVKNPEFNKSRIPDFAKKLEIECVNAGWDYETIVKKTFLKNYITLPE